MYVPVYLGVIIDQTVFERKIIYWSSRWIRLACISAPQRGVIEARCNPKVLNNLQRPSPFLVSTHKHKGIGRVPAIGLNSFL